jgi:hypothetical protein
MHVPIYVGVKFDFCMCSSQEDFCSMELDGCSFRLVPFLRFLKFCMSLKYLWSGQNRSHSCPQDSSWNILQNGSTLEFTDAAQVQKGNIAMS